jgi:hypothetical protein
MTMGENLFLGDIYMQQRQGDLLDEVQHDRLARQAAGRHRIRHLIAVALGGVRRRLETLDRRSRQRREREFTAEGTEGAEPSLG